MNAMIMVWHYLNNNTRTNFVISLSLNANPLISLIPSPPPQMASNFRHLLGCGTIAMLHRHTKFTETERIDA